VTADLAGKTALITGSGRGIGRAIALGLADAGARVILLARTAGQLEETRVLLRERGVPAGRISVVPADLSDEEDRGRAAVAVLEAGRVDILVNNAATVEPLGPTIAIPAEELRLAFEVNVVAPLGLVQDALPLLLDAAHPRVLNVTSDAAVEAYEGWGGYGAGKAALEHLGAVLAVEFPAVTVWSVDPGDLRTVMHQAAFPGEDISDRPEPAAVVPAFIELIASDRPSGRYRAADLVSAEAVT